MPKLCVPNRVVETISVMGRNGDLVLDTGAYNNVEQIYSIYFNAKSTSFQTEAHKVAMWLNGSRGYCRLTDTYDPTVYRMALMSSYTEYKNFLNYMGRADVIFNCKPQRFLLTGETETTLTSGTTVTNNYMPCYPIFTVRGNGTLTVAGNSIVISNNSNQNMTIDCETQNAYTGTTNRNADIVVSGEFPFLASGNNTVTFSNTSCKMIPRWWTL